jgi:hypothetical protein
MDRGGQSTPRDEGDHVKQISFSRIVSLRRTEGSKPVVHSILMMTTSVDQYKKQFKKWKWSKNIPMQIGEFIRQKADQREMEEGKDTEFKFGGRLLTRANIQSWVERNKGDLHPERSLGTLFYLAF